MTHDFSLVAMNSKVSHAFVVLEAATLLDVMRAYVKKYDTGSSVDVVCSSGKADEGALSLAREYGISIIKGAEIPEFFDSKRQRAPERGPAHPSD